VEGRDEAEKLRGAGPGGEQTEVAPLPEGQYRRHEVLGLAVETPEGRRLGTLEDLQENARANWVWSIP
jgi:ribosomal 30S subunit maturation factor RimM